MHIPDLKRKELNMNQGVGTIIYPVKDIARAKKLYNKLLGVELYMDEPYYVGYKVGNQDIGLDPNGYSQGMTGPVCYYHVGDIKKSLQSLQGEGAQVMQEVRDVGGGKLIATVKDTEGNIVGLIQLP
jgi:predicted enzyme related to lactoylglutathione lyase